MKILSIETSCDETAISIVEAKGGIKNPQFKVISNLTLSQAKLHEQYGGVFPNLAKREHSRNLIPILKKVLEDANLLKKNPKLKTKDYKLSTILEREPELLEQFLEFIPTIKKPKIDKIAVTYGPGLEPALWVGINFAKALSKVWKIKVVPVNHMEGHIASILLPQNRGDMQLEAWNMEHESSFPALALLISGGHTELVLVKKWGKYEVIGKTKDDAVGEVFDKVARMLGLPYPGGPEISHLAEKERQGNSLDEIKFPRPMMNTNDFDFSFSGLKTAVLYYLRDNPADTEEKKQKVARAFEDAVADVLISKTKKAIQYSGSPTSRYTSEDRIKSLIIAGGVSANKFLRDSIQNKLSKKCATPGVKHQVLHIFIPSHELSTDNAIMIAAAGYLKIAGRRKILSTKKIKAEGNLSL